MIRAIDVRIARHEDVLQRRVIARNDEVLQVHRSRIHVVVAIAVDRRDVVVVRRLLHEQVHGFLHRDIPRHFHKVRGHARADEVLVIGIDQGDVGPHFGVQKLHEQCLFFRHQGLDQVAGLVGLQAVEDRGGLAESQFVDEPDPFLFVEIFQDLGQSVGFQDPVEFLPFREGKPEKGVCDVACMIVFQLHGQQPRCSACTHGIHDRGLIVRTLSYSFGFDGPGFFLHSVFPLSAWKKGPGLSDRYQCLSRVVRCRGRAVLSSGIFI